MMRIVISQTQKSSLTRAANDSKVIYLENYDKKTNINQGPKILKIILANWKNNWLYLVLQ
jgi:hypothetical protein